MELTHCTPVLLTHPQANNVHGSLPRVHLLIYENTLAFPQGTFHELCFTFKGAISTDTLSGVQGRTAYHRERPTS